MKKTGKKFYLTLVIFSLMGQVAWVVENMYFNVFIYKMFHASAADISLMVAASAIAATLTTWLMGALSDKVGKRKIFICGGYVVWGISILSFAFIQMDILTPLAGSAAAAASLRVSLVIVMDCVMTFFGSTANDACFNAWLTDMGDESNRGKIEGINAMMPLVAILVVFGGFMAFDLDQSASWVTIYLVIGIAVIVIGMLGFFLIEDHVVVSEEKTSYLYKVLYSFRPSVMGENKLLYLVVGAFAIFGISIQIFMPYLILYYEQTLGMTNYVLIMAPAIIVAAVITAFYGKLYDRLGFKSSVVPTVIFLMAGYIFLFSFTSTVCVFVGSLFMMTGYLTGMAIFGAMIRDHMPEDKVGLFQGLRIFGQVFIPGIVGPAIGAWVLRDAKVIVNGDGTTSFLPNRNIYVAAFVAAVVLLIVLELLFRMIQNGHYDLTSENSREDWKQYPRPQMKREHFQSLNGIWDVNGQKVKVPYSLQSSLSGFKGKVPKNMTYRHTFALDDAEKKDHILLHFGALDQVCHVFVNNIEVGSHEGGYLPFTFDITKAVHCDGENELLVKAEDKLSLDYPYGKQTKKRGGMWYTPVSGIWQSVWIEGVPDTYIENVSIGSDLDQFFIKVKTSKSNQKCHIKIFAPVIDQEEENFHSSKDTEDGRERSFLYEQIEQKKAPIYETTCSVSDVEIEINLREQLPEYSQQLQRWSAQEPYLYPMELTVGQDTIQTYSALRKVEVQEKNGCKRLCLNDKPIFMNGVLDQGYFCDGIFLPANEEEYRRDIKRMKDLGYNTLRKHIKIEPEAFYYECDRMGMLVLQDMVNSGKYRFVRDTVMPTLGKLEHKDRINTSYNHQRAFFIKHMKDTQKHLYNHPSIIGYTIFNEGWGQFNADELYGLAKKNDPDRFYDSTSGWFAQEKSDVDSLHIYFRNEALQPKERPMLLSECGGYSYPMEGHIYSKYDSYGYGACKSKTELTNQMIEMYEVMVLPAIKSGLCGCIFTQLSDIEDEINGIYTYDRKICKVEKGRLKDMNERIQIEINRC